MKDRLVTPGYCFILAANFLLYFGFWLLIPVLPFYLSEVFNAGNSTIGIILSCYTVAALCIRPFSGYFLDSFARKPLYLLAYFIFMTMFAGYIIAGSLTLFILVPHHTRRIIRHGDRGRQYGSHRHHALIKTRRRSRILRTLQQHSHGSRADVRFVPARCRYELYHHILLLAGFLYCRVHLCFLSENPV